MECLNCSGIEDSCPAGLFCSGGLCKCRKFPNDLVKCEGEGNTTSLMVLNNYCATFDEQEKTVLVRACVESIFTTNVFAHVPYYSVCPGKLNEFCTKMNKRCIMCGRCIHDYFPPAYSFNMTCVPCPHPHWNWLWYYLLCINYFLQGKHNVWPPADSNLCLSGSTFIRDCWIP